MPKQKKRLVQLIAQEIAQTAELEKVKHFHIEQFIKSHKPVKRCPYAFQSARRSDEKEQE
ncbi:hypothetical protein AAEU23_001616 [Escherichia coli]